MNGSTATEELWVRFHRPLLSFLVNRVDDLQTAEDILQEVFIRAHASLGQLRDDTRITSWLFKIARNAVIDHYRSRGEAPAELDDSLAAEESPLMAEQHLAEGLGVMIEELPENYREVIRMTELESFSAAEVAERLQLSLTATKSRVARGRARLREMILDCCHVELDRHGRILDYWERPVCCDRGSK